MKDWHREMLRLRDEGVSRRQIAKRLGRSYGTIASTLWRFDNPEEYRKQNLKRNEYKRAWDRSKRKCEECGEPCSDPRCSRCLDCERRAQQDAARARCETFLDLRREGLTNVEIAKRFGVDPVVVASSIHRHAREKVPPPYWQRGKRAA